MTTVLIPPPRFGGECFHHPASDAGDHPACGCDARARDSWRSVPLDHPALMNKRECQLCAQVVAP